MATPPWFGLGAKVRCISISNLEVAEGQDEVQVHPHPGTPPKGAGTSG